ncbi:MAG: hypothetical protein PHQ67_07635 [Fermentimonas sp.]|nr:hypothetical protein [Fermentimonas sp.]MDD4437470.1 hypothetical protein [Tissierellia bacterium]
MKVFENYAILEGSNPAIVVESNRAKDITVDSDGKTPIQVIPKGSENQIDFYPWGKDNDLPNKLIKYAFKNNIVASNLDFNSNIGHGEAAIPVKVSVDEISGKLKHTPILRNSQDKDITAVFDFLDDNNFPLVQQEIGSDLALLHNCFVEFIFNTTGTKIVQMTFKEAAYSRLSVMNDDGQIEYHGYSSKWGEESAPEDVVTTPILDYDNPLLDLKIRLGLKAGPKGKQKKTKDRRFILHLGRPSPGKFYYQKAYWWSIFESHWYDLSCAIPEFKMNLLSNQMVLKYHIEVRKGFFDDLYKAEKITDEKKQKERQKEFYQQLEDFLSGKENAGKNFTSEIDYGSLGKEVSRSDIKFTPIESFIKGGEYIEDSEEASNAICYAMGVHPSLQGASPGKNKNINGTEARELFIIKQSLMKPVRELLVQPLKIVKAINKWPDDIDFIIPNIMLTTLDKNTGAEKQIGNPEV